MIAQRGYTLVELVTVMLIMGILASIAAPRFFETNPFADAGFGSDRHLTPIAAPAAGLLP